MTNLSLDSNSLKKLDRCKRLLLHVLKHSTFDSYWCNEAHNKLEKIKVCLVTYKRPVSDYQGVEELMDSLEVNAFYLQCKYLVMRLNNIRALQNPSLL